MKKRLLLIITLFVIATTMSACVTATYKADGQTYKSRDEAMAASMRSFAEADAAISAGAMPLVERKLLVVIPTASAVSRAFEAFVVKQGKTYAAPGTPARAQDDFTADTIVANWKSIAGSLKKANVYQDVLIQDVDSTESNIQPSANQDVLSIYMGAQLGNPTFYFQSAKYGKQVVAADWGKATAGERRRSIIDDIKSKALQ